jgi:hypothetical protein
LRYVWYNESGIGCLPLLKVQDARLISSGITAEKGVLR